jgi:serine-type D-Ala-D-Ala carboxypeptidase (penicillin-binding protein 5/6)
VRTGGSTRRTLTSLVVLAAVLATAFLFMPSSALAAEPLAASLDESIVIVPANEGDVPVVPRVTAKAAIVVDMDTGTVLYSRNPDKQLEMASTTKMMTAILILESLDLDRVVKVPSAAVGAAGSALGLKRGESFTVKELLYMMLVPSANDAAITLAIAQAGTVKAFVAEMNARAEKMGLTKTHFENAWGLHVEGHVSSARDMAEIARVAMRDATFRKIVSTREFTLDKPVGGIRNRVIKTSNELLEDYSWVNGIKTGSTPWADYCLAASATKDGLTLISIVLGAKDQDTREMESKALLEYGFKRCPVKALVEKGAEVVDVPLADPLARTVRLVTAESLSRRLLGEKEVTGRVKLTKEPTLPVKTGDELAELVLTQGDADLGSVKLVAAESVGVPDLRTIMGAWNGPWASCLPLAGLLTALNE